MFLFVLALGILALAIILSVVMLIGLKDNESYQKTKRDNPTRYKNNCDITAMNPADIGYYNPLNLNNPMNF